MRNPLLKTPTTEAEGWRWLAAMFEENPSRYEGNGLCQHISLSEYIFRPSRTTPLPEEVARPMQRRLNRAMGELVPFDVYAFAPVSHAEGLTPRILLCYFFALECEQEEEERAALEQWVEEQYG